MMDWSDCLNLTGNLLILAGFTMFFLSIWSDGWDIVRYAITSIGLTLWGYSMCSNAEMMKIRREVKK